MKVAMKMPSENFVVGSRRKRRSMRGENWLEPNWTASSRIEKTKPVKVIMPPASDPSTLRAASGPKEIPIVVFVCSSTWGRTIPIAIARATSSAGTIQMLLRTYSKMRQRVRQDIDVTLVPRAGLRPGSHKLIDASRTLG